MFIFGVSQLINIFTLRDFTSHGGGMIRILGLLSSLEYNNDDYKIFNNSPLSLLKENVSKSKIEQIDIFFSKSEKRFFQLCLSFLPIIFVNIIFHDKLKKLKALSDKFKLYNETLVFCEYLDLSVGYYMKKNNLINRYICDIHGLVPNEFKSKKDKKLYNFLRYHSARLLDERVFSFSDGVIYASLAMKNHMENEISQLCKIKNIIIPYLVSLKKNECTVDQEKLKKIRDRYRIKISDEVIFFAGSFKELGGVMDLLRAFNEVQLTRDNLKLILVGTGEDVELVDEFIKEQHLLDKVIHIPRVNYSDLRTYQELAVVIVCPDRYNLYSNMIIHLKYIDSLISNKIVINGNFDAVREINVEDKLSINFQPSDVNDLASKIHYCLDNKNHLESRFKNNSDYVLENLVYESKLYSLANID